MLLCVVPDTLSCSLTANLLAARPARQRLLISTVPIGCNCADLQECWSLTTRRAMKNRRDRPRDPNHRLRRADDSSTRDEEDHDATVPATPPAAAVHPPTPATTNGYVTVMEPKTIQPLESVPLFPYPAGYGLPPQAIPSDRAGDLTPVSPFRPGRSYMSAHVPAAPAVDGPQALGANLFLHRVASVNQQALAQPCLPVCEPSLRPSRDSLGSGSARGRKRKARNTSPASSSSSHANRRPRMSEIALRSGPLPATDPATAPMPVTADVRAGGC